MPSKSVNIVSVPTAFPYPWSPHDVRERRDTTGRYDVRLPILIDGYPLLGPLLCLSD